MRFSVLIIPLIGMFSCASPDNGEGLVEGRFSVEECRPSGNFKEQDFRFKARSLGTNRFLDTLTLSILENAVELEETDGLLIRLGDLNDYWSIQERPFTRPISGDPEDVNVSLSLFETCPDRPTLVAVDGQIEFTEFAVAQDPEDTGVEEVLAGTLTATVVAADGKTIAGTIRSEFNYRPERLSITEPR